MEKSIALFACIHFMLKTASTRLVFQSILMWRLCMPWTFWNLLIPTVDSTTRPHQGKQLPSQNNKLLSRVYLRTIYFQTCLQNPFLHSVRQFWTTKWHIMPNSNQSSTLRDSRFSPDLCLSFVLPFEMLPGLPCGHSPAAASSQQGFASFLSQQNRHQMRLYSAGCSGLKLLILLNFFLLLFYAGQYANLSHFLPFDSAPSAGTNTVSPQSI